MAMFAVAGHMDIPGTTGCVLIGIYDNVKQAKTIASILDRVHEVFKLEYDAIIEALRSSRVSEPERKALNGQLRYAQTRCRRMVEAVAGCSYAGGINLEREMQFSWQEVEYIKGDH